MNKTACVKSTINIYVFPLKLSFLTSNVYSSKKFFFESEKYIYLNGNFKSHGIFPLHCKTVIDFFYTFSLL